MQAKLVLLGNRRRKMRSFYSFLRIGVYKIKEITELKKKPVVYIFLEYCLNVLFL